MTRRMTRGRRVINFIQNHCVFSSGKWVGKPFVLLPWEEEFLLELFEVNPETNLRRYRWCLLGIPKKNGKCLSPDALLTMGDGTQKAASDIIPGDIVLSYNEGTGTLEPAAVDAVEIQPTEPIYKITTSRGRMLRTNGEHPYLVRGSKRAPSTDRHDRPRQADAERWVKARDLEVGDRLAIALDWAEDKPFDQHEAWMLGAWAGDGSPDGRFTTADEEILQRFAERFEITPLASRTKTTDYYMRQSPDWLREHGLYGETSATKRVPQAIMTGGRRAAIGFLSGYLDTDGSIPPPHLHKSSAAVEWYSINEALLKDVQHLLASVGINARLAVKRGRYKGEEHISYRLTVQGRQQIIRLAELLDLAVPEKRKRLQTWADRFRAERVNRNDTDTFSTDKVKTIEIENPDHTVGIQVSGNHTHVTEGIITHNSELCAALALYFLIADGEPAPLIVIAAAGEEQANLVFGAAKTMASMSPTLSQITEVYEGEILLKDVPNAKISRVAAAAGTNDGLNIHAAILDELHEWPRGKGDAVWTVLTNGTGAREQPMILQITTAGHDPDTICYEQYEYGTKIASGEIEDPTYYFKWYSAPDGSDHRDPDTWAAANPSYGAILQPAFYEDQLRRKTEAVFRRYFLNQWTATAEHWLPTGLWERLADTDWEFHPRAKMWIGIDAATRYDSTAVVAGQYLYGDDSDEPYFYTKARVWERPLDPATKRPVEEWKLPIHEVADYVRHLHGHFPVIAIGYDPAFISWMADTLEEEGLPMEEFPQTNARMVPAAQTLYEMIVDERLRHDGDPVFARHVRNVVAKQVTDARGGFRLQKGKSRNKMDAAIALAMAAYLSTLPDPDGDPGPPSMFMWDEGRNGAVRLT